MRHWGLQVRRLTSQTQKPRHFDVLVNGGGIVGAAFTAALLKEVGPASSLKIGIIDPRKPPTLSHCLERKTPDVRVYAISPRSIELLEKTGSWKHIEPRSQAYDSMQVWETRGPGVVRFSASETGHPHLGCIVEDCTVQAAIYRALEDDGFLASNGNGVIEPLFGQNITKLEVPRDPETGSAHLAHITLASITGSALASPATEVVTARLVVGADGAASTVRRLSGGTAWGWNYGQEALVGTVRTSSPHFTAWQRYLSTGPLALLPLWDGYSAFVWSLPVMEARRISSLPSGEFLVALNTALQSPTQNDRWSVLEPGDAPFPRPIRELASLVDAALSAALLAQASGSGSSSSAFQQPPIVTEMSSAPLAFPLQLQQAREYTAARIALAGDAAHSIHPQAGQGLNLGLEDARVLASAVAGALGTGGDIGDPAFLRRSYGAPQYAANLAMIGAVDAINGVFSYSGRGAGMLNILRGAGMLAVNSLGTVKTHLAAKAMGRSKG